MVGAERVECSTVYMIGCKPMYVPNGLHTWTKLMTYLGFPGIPEEFLFQHAKVFTDTEGA